MAMRSIQMTIFWTRQIEGAYLSSSRSSGGRFQEILAVVVGGDGEDQMRVNPTSRALAGSGGQAVEVQQALQSLEAFKELKNDLSVRPIHHQLETRIEAHIFVAFLAYCLMVTLKQRLKALAPGLTPKAVLEKLAAIQMIDVELPTTDNRTVVLSRHTEPENDHLLLLQRLKLELPAQPPPKIMAAIPTLAA
jgi:hypothetical protein